GVQGLDAELYPQPLDGRELFEQRQVEVPDAVVADVYRRADIAEGERRRLAEDARVEIPVQPLRHRTAQARAFAVAVRASQRIAPPRGFARGDAQRRPALEGGDAVELPAADQGVKRPMRIAPERTALTERQFVKVTDDEAMRDVNRSQPAVAANVVTV